jgi:hypothetical protein
MVEYAFAEVVAYCEEKKMIKLVLTICSILQGTRCREEKLTFVAENISPWACMHYGQPEIASRIELHPNWLMSKSTCGAPSKST